MKKALITGITGQDGSYLAEWLLSQGYQVHGVVRRSSSENFDRLEAVRGKVTLHQADLLDQYSLIDVVRTVEPEEVYNLAAMSFVPTSWKQPVLTGEFTAMGVTRMLEAIRLLGPRRIRFYQASSSEMFGRVLEVPQKETTPFYPRSPYGVAKAYGHYITVNYRESYGMFACSGILFNHECVTAETPVIIRKDGFVDCVPIAEVMPDPMHVRQRELDFEIWDRGQWTRAKLGTATWNEAGRAQDKRVQRVLARCGAVCATADHQFIRSDESTVRAEEVRAGEKLLTTPLPEPVGNSRMTPELARFLGLMVAEGAVSYSQGKYRASLRNNDQAILEEVASLWRSLFAGKAGPCPGRSGFTGEETGGINLNGSPGSCHWLYEVLYTADGSKRVPRLVLNGDAEIWRSFLSGYNAGDGLKAGHGDREFKNFKTSSPVLAAGLWWMASQVLEQKLTLNIDRVERESGDYFYYSINLGVEGGSSKGVHLLRPEDEVKRIREEPYTGWLYDIETESGTFHAGVGNLVIHNSPRRGLEFVTRKVTDGAAKIKLGLAKELRLGNLDAKRDWGFAGDYVKAMWLMLQQDKPDDYVVATGETHSVQELVELAFETVGLDWKKYVVTDPSLVRPAEVDLLIGDPAKAKRELKWQPEVDFRGLVKMMVESDLQRLKAAGSRG